MKHIFIFLSFTFLSLNLIAQSDGSSQYSIDHLKLAYDNATYIFEGKVIDQESYWNSEHTSIYTSNTIQVTREIGTDLPTHTVELVTEGGEVNDTMLYISHNLTFQIGERGLFFTKSALRPPNPNSQHLGLSALQDYEGAFVKFFRNGSDTNGVYLGHTFNCLEELYTTLGLQTHSPCAPPPMFKKSNLNLTISGTSKADIEVIGGVGDQVIITGQNLGTTPGFIRLRSADDGGASFVTLDSYDINEWNDSTIIFTVPSMVPITNPTSAVTPGSGKIRIVNPSIPDSAETSNKLVIKWAWRNYASAVTPPDSIKNKIFLAGDSINPGLEFSLNANIITDPLAEKAIREVVKQWVCGTEVRWTVDSVSFVVSNVIAMDEKSIIAFGPVTVPTAAAQTRVWSTRCVVGTTLDVGYVFETDIIFNVLTDFFIQDLITDTLPEGKFDFWAIAFHEFGHAHLMNHVNDIFDHMFWAANPGKTGGTPWVNRQTAFSLNSLLGGNEIVDFSVIANYGACPGVEKMIRLSLQNCSPAPVSIGNVRKVPDIETSVYPNPFGERVTVSYTLTNTTDVDIALFNHLGVRVCSVIKARQQAGAHSIGISGTELPSGFYFVRILVNHESYTTKLIHVN